MLRQRLKGDPSNPFYQIELAITLAWLGQRDEAARLAGAVEPLWKEAAPNGAVRHLAHYYAALGDAKSAAPYLAVVLDGSPFESRKITALDPRWEKLRGQPEFEALLKTVAAKK